MPFHVERIDAILYAASHVVEDYYSFRRQVLVLAQKWRQSDSFEMQAAAAALDIELNLTLMPVQTDEARNIIQRELIYSESRRSARKRDKAAKSRKLSGSPAASQQFSRAALGGYTDAEMEALLKAQAKREEDAKWNADGSERKPAFDENGMDASMSEDQEPDWSDSDSDSDLVPNSPDSP